jgi:hypothetical protein
MFKVIDLVVFYFDLQENPENLLKGKYSDPHDPRKSSGVPFP